MKSFLKKKWRGAPVGIITAILLVCLVAGGAFAGVLIEQDQTITQVVEEWEYGSIAVEPTITLPTLKVGETYNEDYSEALPEPVVVEVGPDGVGKYLHIKLDKESAELYDAFEVGFWSGKDINPMENDIWVSAYFGVTAGEMTIIPGEAESFDTSIQLTEPGSYTFSETVAAIAGDAAGTAKVKITITLEDEPATVNVEPY